MGGREAMLLAFEGGERQATSQGRPWRWTTSPGTQAASRSWKDFQNKNRVTVSAELDKKKRKLLMQNQSSTTQPEASLHSQDPLLRTSRVMSSSSAFAPQQKAALKHSHASGHCITQARVWESYFFLVLPGLTQKEENLCDENKIKFIISNANVQC